MEQAGVLEEETRWRVTYVEGDDDASGVIVGQLDGSTEVSMVVRRLGHEPGARAAIEFEADGAAVRRPDEVVAAKQRHEAGLERHRRRVQRRGGENRRPAHHHQRNNKSCGTCGRHG